jgi:hypothetical protein
LMGQNYYNIVDEKIFEVLLLMLLDPCTKAFGY